MTKIETVTDSEYVMQKVREIAKEKHDGHFTIMGFTTGYRISFGEQPCSREDIEQMPSGDSLFDALTKAIINER